MSKTGQVFAWRINWHSELCQNNQQSLSNMFFLLLDYYVIFSQKPKFQKPGRLRLCLRLRLRLRLPLRLPLVTPLRQRDTTIYIII